MSTFRCSSGHRVQLAFGDEHVRQPCPTCGIDIYKFRDLVPEDETPTQADAAEPPGAGRRGLSLGARHARFAIAGLAIVLLTASFAWHRLATRPARANHDPVIPVVAAPNPERADPSAVSITHFTATPTAAGVVRLNFRLTNAGAASNGYPSLAVHWHGIPDADQRIGKDSYAHPPLPFTSTSVTLELARPRGATGIDVKITD